MFQISAIQLNKIGLFLTSSVSFIAIYLQYHSNWQSCWLCLIERSLLLYTGICFLISLKGNPRMRVILLKLKLLGCLLGVMVSAYHIHLEYQPERLCVCYVPLAPLNEGFTFKSFLQKIFQETGNCKKPYGFLHLSLASWTGIIFSLLLGLLSYQLRSKNCY
jgi:protein dithiol:quinone oxidoreductase